MAQDLLIEKNPLIDFTGQNLVNLQEIFNWLEKNHFVKGISKEKYTIFERTLTEPIVSYKIIDSPKCWYGSHIIKYYKLKTPQSLQISESSRPLMVKIRVKIHNLKKKSHFSLKLNIQSKKLREMAPLNWCLEKKSKLEDLKATQSQILQIVESVYFWLIKIKEGLTVDQSKQDLLYSIEDIKHEEQIAFEDYERYINEYHSVKHRKMENLQIIDKAEGATYGMGPASFHPEFNSTTNTLKLCNTKGYHRSHVRTTYEYYNDDIILVHISTYGKYSNHQDYYVSPAINAVFHTRSKLYGLMKRGIRFGFKFTNCPDADKCLHCQRPLLGQAYPRWDGELKKFILSRRLCGGCCTNPNVLLERIRNNSLGDEITQFRKLGSKLEFIAQKIQEEEICTPALSKFFALKEELVLPVQGNNLLML